MKRRLQNPATAVAPVPPPPEADAVAVPRDDVENLSAYEVAARTLFVAANGLQVYYRTYYKTADRAGWGAGSRKGDVEQFVWRAGSGRQRPKA